MKCPYCKCEHPEGGQHFITVPDGIAGVAKLDTQKTETPISDIVEILQDKYWENQRLIDELQEYSAGLEYVVNQQGGE